MIYWNSNVKGENSISNFENTIINKGVLLEISITHRKTIDPNAKFYGSGNIEIIAEV